jgi:hypothetical protein
MSELLKSWLVPLLIFQLFIVIAAVLGNGVHPLLFFLQFIVWTSTGIILCTKKGMLRRLGVGLLSSVLLVMLLSIIGFYANAEVAPGEFSHKPMEVSDLSIGSALQSSITEPAVFTASLFGYECQSNFFVECSNGLYYFATGLVEFIFGTGAIIGSLWASQRREYIKSEPAA